MIRKRRVRVFTRSPPRLIRELPRSLSLRGCIYLFFQKTINFFIPYYYYYYYLWEPFCSAFEEFFAGAMHQQGNKSRFSGILSSKWDIKCSSWDIKSSRWDIKVPKINQHNSGRKTAFFRASSGHPTITEHTT